jgi:hypothetical protein
MLYLRKKKKKRRRRSMKVKPKKMVKRLPNQLTSQKPQINQLIKPSQRLKLKLNLSHPKLLGGKN